MQLLLSRWLRTCEGHGQLVLMIGEPEIGKSRLVEEFRGRIKSTPHLWSECAGEHSYANTPFRPVTQILDQGLGWRGDESKIHAINLSSSFTISPKGITVAASGTAGINPGNTNAMKSLSSSGTILMVLIIWKLLPRSARD